ncbi:MAG: hypothetical protein ABSH25_11815 [Syntrophorhabdales bacterium]
MNIIYKTETEQNLTRSLASRSMDQALTSAVEFSNLFNPGGAQVDAGTTDSPATSRTQHTHRAA